MNSGQDSAVLDAIDKGNKVVFMDIALGGGGATDSSEDGKAEEGKPLGRIKLELFVNDCPKTCENFRRAPGSSDQATTRLQELFFSQTGKTCIYGSSTFSDENLTTHKHNAPGQLCMANSGPNSNGCQFYITCKAAEWLDGKHCVFGRVLDAESLMTVRKCELVPTKGGANQPRYPLRVVECGEL
ncbi:hypothetical protein THAOC_10189 [Thalassiosira oceanica]|uniref:Peptidyl-prolyl cis-trans isomerase n=1 Tax=Thalassiosira oceanica TaxID=159749 RepID=K0SUK3_THAOC|nr:hypothetical protein THAOC_10189 [Thalassiosira oceanica]|eukprot:EJK68614.1 hypothetical protein THAOC_10189 [Thalassiosira oceanica]